MDWITDPNALVGLSSRSPRSRSLLGIDNIIFISILSSKLPKAEQPRARQLGLGGAFLTRIQLLLSIAWIVRLTKPLFSFAGIDFTGRSLILLVGGLFLIAKATFEIHGKLEGSDG
jgi:predicted tellurium resistance membrane protein TerC